MGVSFHSHLLPWKWLRARPITKKKKLFGGYEIAKVGPQRFAASLAVGDQLKAPGRHAKDLPAAHPWKLRFISSTLVLSRKQRGGRVDHVYSPDFFFLKSVINHDHQLLGAPMPWAPPKHCSLGTSSASHNGSQGDHPTFNKVVKLVIGD